MQLSDLIATLAEKGPISLPVIEISHIACDSRQVVEGALFVAIPGTKMDGNSFIPEAISRGARAVIVQEGSKFDSPGDHIPFVTVPNARLALAHVADVFFGQVTNKLSLVGITGTNGKTTTSFLIESVLKSSGCSTGVIGTVSCRFGEETRKSSFTTPDPVQLQKLLHQMAARKISHVVMEVSSHALDQDRVDSCRFDAVVFTNLSRDHLDYHKDMSTYFRCKERLFTEVLDKSKGAKRPCSIINLDDPWGKKIAGTQRGRLLTYGIEDQQADVTAQDFLLTLDGIRAVIRTPEGKFLIHSPLLGRYNLYNILAAASVGVALGIPCESIRRGIEGLQGVPGRMQRIESYRRSTVLVDYAHTPDALENVLSTLRGLNPKRIISVFGCGGNRDQGKRHLMGRVAALFSHLVILTSDNPRDEEPLEIIKDIEEGIKGTSLSKLEPFDLLTNGCKQSYTIIPDRHEAIRLASRLARDGDAVLIAGKGHEDCQIIKGQLMPFDDFLEAKNAFSCT